MAGVMAVLFAVGVFLGTWLLGYVLQPTAKRPPGVMQLAHGGAGAGGIALAALLLSQGRDPGSLGWQALGLALVALVLGLVMWLAGRRLGAMSGMVLAVHGLCGAVGAAILAVWALG